MTHALSIVGEYKRDGTLVKIPLTTLEESFDASGNPTLSATMVIEEWWQVCHRGKYNWIGSVKDLEEIAREIDHKDARWKLEGDRNGNWIRVTGDILYTREWDGAFRQILEFRPISGCKLLHGHHVRQAAKFIGQLVLEAVRASDLADAQVSA